MSANQPALLWTPSEPSRTSTTLSRYAESMRAQTGRPLASYEELWRWSVDELDAFWSSIVEFFGVDLGAGHSVILADRSMPGARWCPDATVSYPEHVFRDRDPDTVAILHAAEARDGLGEWTWRRLRAETARIATGLAAGGVGRGDRVCAYMPNIPETMAAFLATASLGAVWSSAAPEFGARSVIDRFVQVQPTVLLAIDGYRSSGREFDRGEIVTEVASELADTTRIVRFGYLDASGWEDGFLGPADAQLTFERVPFDHPLRVLDSSGTTGLPKPIVHSQGGILIEQVTHHNLHLDARPGDRVFWPTTTGWMMWNFLVGVLLSDASVVLLDGDPGYPSLERLWDLSLLRAVGSTGSPLSPESFEWVYDELGNDTWLFSTSGGTDVCTSFVGGCRRCRSTWASCRLAASGDGDHPRSLGLDDQSRRGANGDRGDLPVRAGRRRGPRRTRHRPVRRRPRPSRRRDAVVRHPPRRVALDDALTATIRARVRDDCSPRHVPYEVRQVPAIPRTLSGKLLEVAVKRILTGTPPAQAASRESLADPEALDYFIALAGKDLR